MYTPYACIYSIPCTCMCYVFRSLGGRQGQGSELSRLKQELSHAHSQLQSQIQQEKGLRDEMKKLQHRYMHT